MAVVMRSAAAIFAVFLLIAPAAAQSPAPSPVLELQGKVKQPQHWTLDDLKKMQAQHVQISYQTERGQVGASYTGVLLWSLLEQAGGIDDTTRNAVVFHTIRITATDNYVIVLSTGEIAPDYGNIQALVAYERDGKPLDNFRVVMPGDKHGARDIHDVATIKVE